MVSTASIEDICKDVSRTDAINACNFFVQNVAKKIFGDVPAYLRGTAREIATRLSTPGVFLPVGSGDLATLYASEGYFVIGGIAERQHVFVVVPGGPSPKGVATPWTDGSGHIVLSRGGMPYAYNGATNPRLRIPARIGVDIIFNPRDFDKVKYGALIDPRSVPKCPAGSSKARDGQSQCR